MLAFMPLSRSLSSSLCVLAIIHSQVTAAPTLSDHILFQRQSLDDLVERRAPAQAQSPLVNFQVSEPVLTPSGSGDKYGCIHTQVLMNHTFGNSYGAPFAGSYSPPPCSFNRVTINLTVTVQGRQFDRLGIMYLGEVEVFRTSTAEPTSYGIVWTYVKEMEQYNALWVDPQEIVFALPNIIAGPYTGYLAATLTATFFTVPFSPATADKIIPITATQSGPWGTAFTLPSDQGAVRSMKIPQNVARAVISLSACGQGTEEFWYTNVFNKDVDTFAPTMGGSASGYSPFREVQILIDGNLAGVHWPYPVVFTGGIVPGFWRPIAGIDAFDLRQHEIDVTPWLPILCDGKAHKFEIKVRGLNDDNTLSDTIGSFWLVSATMFLFLDAPGSVTTGTAPVFFSTPSIMTSSSLTRNSSGYNETLTYSTEVKRSLTVSSSVKTSDGSHPISWTQLLSYSNHNNLTAQGFTQYSSQNTSGEDNAPNAGYKNTYYYPISVNSSFSQVSAMPDGPGGKPGPLNTTISGTISLGLDYNVDGASVFPSGLQSFNVTSPAVLPTSGGVQSQESLSLANTFIPRFSGSQLSTRMKASAVYSSQGNVSYTFGTTLQDFDFAGVESTLAPKHLLTKDQSQATVELYHRHVVAVNSTITEDQQDLIGHTYAAPIGLAVPILPLTPFEAGEFSVRALLGRGPGLTKAQLSGWPHANSPPPVGSASVFEP